jgi:hypothetical protein
MKIGKIATAIALDGKEKEEKLFPPNQPKDHWYEALRHSLQCASWSALKKKKVRVITFNYDRTLECYLCGVIENNFKISRGKAAGWLSEEFVIHPHGHLASTKGSVYIGCLWIEKTSTHASKKHYGQLLSSQRQIRKRWHSPNQDHS